MDEFALIRHYFAPLQGAGDAPLLGIGDDCALLAPPAGEVLALSTDTLVAGRHFPLETAAFDIGWKALAVNLSDLAAMGAQPRAFLLALTLPTANTAWLAEFSAGLGQLAAEQGCALAGGDTTRGPLSITITVIGSVPAALALRRDGARAGDLVCVTGPLGDAALALRLGATAPDALRARLDRPHPRVACGLALRGLAHAALDLSDGLAGDLQHILRASGVGAEINIDALPASPAFLQHSAPEQRLALQAAGGDDYELCVCLAPQDLAEARQRAQAAGCDLHLIGQLSDTPGLRWRDASGALLSVTLEGWQHF